MLGNYRSGFRASLGKKRDPFPQKGEERGEKRGDRDGKGAIFSFKDTLELLAFAWA